MAKTISLLASDPDNDSITYIILSGPSHGTLTGAPPSVTYTTTSNYSGPDSFTFKTNDGTSDSNVATVLITINQLNDAPTAQNQSVSVSEDTEKTITLASDVDGNTLSIPLFQE
jgi:hypothetical protein